MNQKIKIVFLDSSSMGDSPLDEIAALGDLICYDESSPQEALERVGDCEVVITNKVRITEELLCRAPKLKLVTVAATGMNIIDFAACEARGIIVKNAVGYSTETVLQTTFMHILELMGSGSYFDNRVKSGIYSAGRCFTDFSRPIVEIWGKTIGIIGMGTIGKRVADVSKAFGMDIIYYSTSGTSHCRDYPSVSLDELLRRADIVSIHAPLNDRTRGLIGAAEFAKMKKSAIIVNLGRGYIIDEEALAAAIDKGEIAGAGLDVYAAEPLPADSPLLKVKHPERLSLSPHVGWVSVEARHRLISCMADNIRSIFG